MRQRRHWRQRTIFLVDLLLHVEVDARDDDVGDDVESAHAVQDIRVVERYLLGDLHKPPTCPLVSRGDGWADGSLQDDDQVRTTRCC